MRQQTTYSFDGKGIEFIRHHLLKWYSSAKRDLPWRQATANPDRQQHAYAVWVSEIMLQQTRVATVIDYYNRWMSKWPTVQDLAGANIEQVNEAWAGLGYYSRARRLQEGARIIVEELKGKMPENSSDLMKFIPGVGRYTAAAISSIAFGEQVGVLDGNVIRVLCRLLTIGGDVTSKNVINHLWKLVDDLIPSESSGDFNQAMMELGALVCTPKSPQCSQCPLQSICKAYAEVKEHRKENSVISGKTKKRKSSDDKNSVASKKLITADEKDYVVDIESCADFLALPKEEPWLPNLGVMNYPRKPGKKAPRQETAFISVIEMTDGKVPQFLINQRPNSGLLAGLWEFPSLQLTDDFMSGEFKKYFGEKNQSPTSQTQKFIAKHTDPVFERFLSDSKITERSHVGEITHIFSHIHLRYIIEHLKVTQTISKIEPKNDDDCSEMPWKWVNRDELSSCAMSSAMHKILKLCENGLKRKKVGKNAKTIKTDVKQKKLDSFFTLKSKNNNDVKIEK